MPLNDLDENVVSYRFSFAAKSVVERITASPGDEFTLLAHGLGVNEFAMSSRNDFWTIKSKIPHTRRALSVHPIVFAAVGHFRNEKKSVKSENPFRTPFD